MSSQWASVDPARRRLFLLVMAAVVAMLVWIGYEYVTADSPDNSTTGKPAATRPAGAATVPGITVPPGHDDGDGRTPPPPARTQQPIQLPPRYTQPPAVPVSEGDLKTANDSAQGFIEVFANGRWDDKPDDKISTIGSFVDTSAIDVVLAQYERIRPKTATHEAVTFKVTAARWVSMAEGQLTLAVDGVRYVSDDQGDRTTGLSFTLTLVRKGPSGWKVASARDPSEGDVGMGTR